MPRTHRRQTLAKTLFLVFLSTLSAWAHSGQSSILLTDVAGEVKRAGKTLGLLSSLAQKDLLHLAPGAHAVIAYLPQAREFALQGPGSFRIDASRVTSLRGATTPQMRELPSIYREISIDSTRLGQAGARLRAERKHSSLEPSGLIAAPIRLFRWPPVAGAEGYIFRLADRNRNPIYEARLQDTALLLPETVLLKTGARYYWRVEAVGVPEGLSWTQFRSARSAALGEQIIAARPAVGAPRSEQVLYALLTERPLPD